MAAGAGSAICFRFPGKLAPRAEAMGRLLVQANPHLQPPVSVAETSFLVGDESAGTGVEADAEVLVGAISFRVHRAVVAPLSPFLAVMLDKKSGFVEASAGSAATIKDLSPAGFSSLLIFLYCDVTCVPASWEEFLELARMSDMFGIKALEHHLTQYLRNFVDTDENILRAATALEAINCRILCKELSWYIAARDSTVFAEFMAAGPSKELILDASLARASILSGKAPVPPHLQSAEELRRFSMSILEAFGMVLPGNADAFDVVDGSGEYMWRQQLDSLVDRMGIASHRVEEAKRALANPWESSKPLFFSDPWTASTL